MNRIRLGLCALCLTSGCTADFFVGPEGGGSSSSGGSNDADPSSATADPLTTTGPDGGTTQVSTTQEPEPTTSSSTDPSTTTAPETTDDTEVGSAETDGEAGGDTEDPGDCIVKEGRSCEAAFPTCLWDGEECAVNLCDVGGEKACLTEAPDCIWEGGGCIPSECTQEAECSVLDPGPCEKARGCVLQGEQCFTPACVPCAEVDNITTCNELPNCTYNEGREACLPQ